MSWKLNWLHCLHIKCRHVIWILIGYTNLFILKKKSSYHSSGAAWCDWIIGPLKSNLGSICFSFVLANLSIWILSRCWSRRSLELNQVKVLGKEIKEVDCFHINFSKPYTKFCKDDKVAVKKIEPEWYNETNSLS